MTNDGSAGIRAWVICCCVAAVLCVVVAGGLIALIAKGGDMVHLALTVIIAYAALGGILISLLGLVVGLCIWIVRKS